MMSLEMSFAKTVAFFVDLNVLTWHHIVQNISSYFETCNLLAKDK